MGQREGALMVPSQAQQQGPQGSRAHRAAAPRGNKVPAVRPGAVGKRSEMGAPQVRSSRQSSQPWNPSNQPMEPLI